MDNNRKQVEVVINGRIYKLGTTDSEEYIKSVASYVDRKYRDIVDKTDSITRVSEYFPIMLALNITDDLFKRSQETGKDLKEAEEQDGKIAALEEQLKEAGKTIRLKDVKISELEAFKAKAEKLEDFKAKAEKLKAAIETKNVEPADDIGSVNELEDVKNELEEKTKELAGVKAELEEKEAEIISLKARLEESSYNLSAKTEELAGIKAQLESEKSSAESEALENQLAAVNAELEAKAKELEESESRNKAAEAALQSLNITLKSKEENEKALEEKLKAAEEKLENAADNDEITKLKEENKRMADALADAGILAEPSEKKGKAKDKYKDRDTLLKELNDIKSEYGRLKKTNIQLNERIKTLEEGL